MKKWWAVVSLLVLLTGCGGNDPMEEGLTFRKTLLESEGCSFTAQVTADYGQELHSFTLECKADKLGDLTFQVVEPETISNITGAVSGSGGRLTFEDMVLAFPLMADNTFSPVAAPWVVLKALRSGYLSAVSREGETLRLSLEDGASGEEVLVEVWLDASGSPIQGDILHEGRRILSAAVSNFQFR